MNSLDEAGTPETGGAGGSAMDGADNANAQPMKIGDAMEVDGEHAAYGPLTHDESWLEEIHTQRDRVLREISEQLQQACATGIKMRYGTGKINKTGGCMQFSKAVRYETSTMMDDELMFSAQWWMCNGISTVVFMLNVIFTYVLYSVSGGHIFCNHVLSRCGEG